MIIYIIIINSKRRFYMDSTMLTLEQLCSIFDHTNLKPYADADAFRQLCREASDNHFAMVAINPAPVHFCKSLLQDSCVHVGAAIAFPLGQTTIRSKAQETLAAIEDGADEIDYVINIGELKSGNTEYIRAEMETIVKICREHAVLSKVILETCYLTEDEIVTVSSIARDICPDYIKTSTGFGPEGATVKNVRLMKQTVGDRVKVKAAGGIRSWDACRAMIEAGAERIGTSSSLKIIAEFLADRQAGVSAQ